MHATTGAGLWHRFTIVAFDAALVTLAADRLATSVNVAAAIAAVRALRPGVGTNLSDAWLRTAAEIERSLLELRSPAPGGVVTVDRAGGAVGRCRRCGTSWARRSRWLRAR